MKTVRHDAFLSSISDIQTICMTLIIDIHSALRGWDHLIQPWAWLRNSSQIWDQKKRYVLQIKMSNRLSILIWSSRRSTEASTSFIVNGSRKIAQLNQCFRRTRVSMIKPVFVEMCILDISDSDVWYTFQIHQSEIRRDSPASDDWHRFSCICPSLPVGCNKKVRGTSRSKVSPLKSLSSWDSEATCMFLTIMIKLRKKLCKGIKKLTLTIKPRQLIQNLILWSHRPDTHVSLSMIFFELTQRLDENTRTQHHTLNWESLIQQSDPNWWHRTKEC